VGAGGPWLTRIFTTSSTPARLETRPSNSGNRWSEPPATIRIDETNITEREKAQIDLISTVNFSQIYLNALPLMSQYPPSRIYVGVLFQDREEESRRRVFQEHFLYGVITHGLWYFAEEEWRR
jgi:hypothetical protein